MDRQALRSLFFVVAISACSPPATPPEDESALGEGDFFEYRVGAMKGRTGCPALPKPCPFGEQFSDLRDHPDLETVSEQMLTSEMQLTTDLQRAQLVLAVQQSSHTDVRTPSEALSRVDQQEIRQVALQQRAGSATYTVYEYGVGDNSYGAIFATDSPDVLASIHDGDLTNCVAAP